MTRVFFLCLLFLATRAGAGDMMDARQAFLDGHHEAALRILRPAAEGGNAMAQNIVGAAYEGGNGVEQDALLAVDWYERSAAQGHDKAHHNLGRVYLHGQPGIPVDYEQAIHHFQQAMARRYGHSFYERGRMAMNGQGTSIDVSSGLNWLNIALVSHEIGDAGNQLGEIYRTGQGVEVDEAKARQYYSQAAALGNGLATGNLALAYEIGLGGDTDASAAHALYLRAVDLGDINGAVNFAYFLAYNEGYWQGAAEGYAWCLWAEDKASAAEKDKVISDCQKLGNALDSEAKTRAQQIADGH